MKSLLWPLKEVREGLMLIVTYRYMYEAAVYSVKRCLIFSAHVWQPLFNAHVQQDLPEVPLSRDATDGI